MSQYPDFESARRKCVDLARIKNVSMERLTKLFEDLQQIIEMENIELENLYNMDKSRFSIGDIEASQHIINATVFTLEIPS